MSIKTTIIPICCIAAALITYSYLYNTPRSKVVESDVPNTTSTVESALSTPVAVLKDTQGSFDDDSADAQKLSKNDVNSTSKEIGIDEEFSSGEQPLEKLKEILPELRPDIEEYLSDISAQQVIVDAYKAKIIERNTQLTEGGSASGLEYELSLERDAILEDARQLGEKAVVLNAKIRDFAQNQLK